MVIKAEIQSIDFTGNTCTVRMPFFENAAGGDIAIASAIIANPPGVYNGYKVGDIVLVAFNEGQAQTPCVIGKLYLGSTTEKNSTAGSIAGNTLDITEQASLPITTKLTTPSQTVSTNLQVSNYGSILDITNDIIKLKSIIGLSAETSAQIPTIICNGLTTNIYGYSDPRFTVEKNTEGSYYILKYNNNSKILKGDAQQYMLYMTGQSTLQPFNEKQYWCCFVTTSRKIYYPIWNESENSLKFKIINDESLEDLIKRLIEESGRPLVVTDLSYGPDGDTWGRGITETDATTTKHAITNALNIEVEDLT